MFACDHSRRRSGRPAAAQIDAFAIEAHINDDDHGCKIITLPGHFPLVVNNRSEAAARAFHSAFHDPPKVERPHQQPPERLWETFISGLSSASSPHANSPRPKR
jgi:hypothetical protein